MNATDLADFGIPDANVRWLDEARPENIKYLDLIAGISLRSDSSERKVRPVAVVESNQEPLLYLVQESLFEQAGNSASQELVALRQKLAMRGSGAYVALSQAGKLTVFSVGLGESLPNPIVRRSSDLDALGLFSELSSGSFVGGGSPSADSDNGAFRSHLFELLTLACDELLECKGLRRQTGDVLSLVGRALFSRFLIDRGLMPQQVSGEQPYDCFSTPSRAAKVCKWLDETFNGDLLELADHKYTAFFQGLGPGHSAFSILSNVLHGAPGGQQLLNFWRNADFSHVPVDLLSEVYEQLAHQHENEAAKAESIHYTPRHIASYMVDQAFSAIPKGRKALAHCLDPACGGGVFLVLCFRRLVAEHWQKTGRRPTRKQLREIIYRQIRGFDINESALKLAALGLYLAALEMDPAPRQQGDFQFRPMRGEVLICVRGKHDSPTDSFVLGSLSAEVPDTHLGHYDLIVGNPPWTAWRPSTAGADKVKQLSAVTTSIARRIAFSRAEEVGGARGETLFGAANGYSNPDSVPDLGFVWRAMEWAKPGAAIALALHGRLLFKATSPAIAARDALFSALRVTGILNGASVRQEPVWPNIDAPWCLLFAINEVPHDSEAFYLVSPDYEPALNRVGKLRIDYKAAEPIQFSALRENPTLLKSVYRGNSIDSTVIAQLRQVGTPLGEYVESLGIRHGDGYQLSLNTRSGKLTSASHLIGLPDLTAKKFNQGRVRVDELTGFAHEKARRPKERDQYRAPLLVVPESIRPDRERGALVYLDDVAYSESFYGYSASDMKRKDAICVVRYLHALTYSSLFYHFALMSSSKFGVERDSILKEDIDAFPVIEVGDISSQELAKFVRFSEQIESGACDFEKLDDAVARLYGLTPIQAQAVVDAFEVAMPYQRAKSEASRGTTSEERQHFVNLFARQIGGLLELVRCPLNVQLLETRVQGWRFVELSSGVGGNSNWRGEWLTALADDEGASVVYLHTSERLIIGMLDQYRYWTASQAILCVDEVVRRHCTQFLRKMVAG